MEASNPLTTSLTGQLPFILISSAALAWPISLGLLKLYRTKVIKTMGTASGHGRKISPPIISETSESQAPQPQLNLSFLDSASPLLLGSRTQRLFQKTIQAPNQLALVYIGGGIGYALIMALCYLSATENAFLLKRFLPLFWMYAWPTVLTITLVGASTPEIKRLIMATYFGIFLCLSGWVSYGNPDVGLLDMPMVWLIYNLGPTVILLAFLARRIRAVGPLVFIFLFVAMLGSHLGLSIAGNSKSSLRFATQLGMAFGFNAVGIFLCLLTLGFVLFGGLGWLLAQSIGKLYKNKTISDQSITVDALFLLFGVVHSISLVFGGIGWIISGPLAFLGFKVFAKVCDSLTRNKSEVSGHMPRLLLLRVFSLGKHSEELFDAVGLHWRHIGPIQLIAGPDLATTTVEPHEFLDFLSGKLARRFIDGPKTLKARLDELDVKPDHDRRFRVTDFFCHADTWQMVLTKLVGESDVILMDLRGFSRQNTGCQFEVKELINVMPLKHVVFIIDHTTDEIFLQEMVHQLWGSMKPSSPNRQHSGARLTMFRLQSSKRSELFQLLRVICQATEDTVGKAGTKTGMICLA